MSPRAGAVLLPETIPQLLSLNRLGKLLYVIVIGASGVGFVLLIVGVAIRKAYI